MRVQLASLIGLLIRHSTFVDDSLANSGILGALTDGLRDKQEKVRRFSMAALGELLFYISTQNADCRDNIQLESPSKDNRTTHGWQGRDDFQITLLRIFESLTEESPVILRNPDIFIHEILPSLTVLYKGNKDGDARFLCLKILFDVMIILLSEPIEEEQRLKDLKFISNTRFLPLYLTLIEDEDPIPIYAQKLLLMLLEFNFITIPDLLHLKTISQCFEFLLGDLSNANVNNVKLCLALASAPEMESKLLSHLKVVRRIGNFLEFVYAKGMEDLLEPTLGLCRAFLARSVGCTKGFSNTTEPFLIGDCAPELSGGAVDHQQCIKDIADFGSNVSVLLELSASTETNIADIASECVVLLLKVAPREATTGILTNLPKVTVILETWN